MWGDVEEVAAAVVREYLNRKGLKATIACMDEELPRTNRSINNRSELCRVLHLESLYKKNKYEEQPLKSMLELMTRERMRNSGDMKRRLSEADHKPGSAADEEHVPEMRLSETSSFFRLSSSTSPPPATDANLNPATPTAGLLTGQTGGIGDRQSSRGSRTKNGNMAGPTASFTQPRQENSKRNPVRKIATSLSLNKEADSNGTSPRRRSISPDASQSRSEERESTATLGADRAPRLKAPKIELVLRREALHLAGLILEDVDDQEVSPVPSAVLYKAFSRPPDWSKRPMDQKTAAALREMILGSSTAHFSTEWRCQSFTFSSRAALRYGIVQEKGGPCGVFAAVQAAVLQKLLFEGRHFDALSERLSDALRTKCLSDALAGILWRAADRKNATVAINSGRSHFTSTAYNTSEDILELTTCIEVQSFDCLKLLIEQHIHQFESGPFGCVLLIVSAILSRTIVKVKRDMDDPTSSLIGEHGFCTQELVNLLLCGSAVSNVFDDEMKLDSGNGNFTLLKGIRERSDIGLLSLYEHYNICTVGWYLKNPRFPIWLVFSESHFSVLFSPCEDLTSSQRSARHFEMFYYDGLANQQEPIRLTVYPAIAIKTLCAKNPLLDLTPPLELCIRTRWTDAAVSWNESEPIL